MSIDRNHVQKAISKEINVKRTRQMTMTAPPILIKPLTARAMEGPQGIDDRAVIAVGWMPTVG